MSGSKLSVASLSALRFIVRNGGKFRTRMGPTKYEGGRNYVNLHTAWALYDAGLVRLRDAGYIETTGHLSPLAKQLLNTESPDLPTGKGAE